MDEYPVVLMPPHELEGEEEYERLYAASPEIIALLSVFYGAISILAVIGNSLVIWVVTTTKQMRTVTNMYIANLAFADVTIGLFCVPFQFQAALLQRWNLPEFMCGFCPFVQALSVNVSVFTLTAIAVDRHRAIINPLRTRPSKFTSKLIIAVIWLVAFIFALPCAIAFRVEIVHELIKEDNIVYNITRPFCMNVNLTDGQLQTYRYVLVFVQYLVPFFVISFVYMQMAVRLWGTRTPGNAQDARDIALLKNKKKVIKMLIIVVVVFGFCWLPLQLYNVLHVTIPEINEYHFISIVFFCCDWLAMSNSCYNPFIYGIYNEKFKREFKKRFVACFCKRQANAMAGGSVNTRGTSMRSSLTMTSLHARHPLMRSNSRSVEDRNAINNKNSLETTETICPLTGTGHAMAMVKGNATKRNDTDNAAIAFERRRLNFKPQYPDLLECDDDDNNGCVIFDVDLFGNLRDGSPEPHKDATTATAAVAVAINGKSDQRVAESTAQVNDNGNQCDYRRRSPSSQPSTTTAVNESTTIDNANNRAIRFGNDSDDDDGLDEVNQAVVGNCNGTTESSVALLA